MQEPTTTTGGTMYTKPDGNSRVGRMLAGLMATSNKRAQVKLTVDITKAAGGSYHQAFRVKAWDTREGVRMLTLDLNDGDWAEGTYATKVAHVNTQTGELKPAKGMADKALLYAAFAAVEYGFTGKAPQPGNGTVRVEEAGVCGCCGLTLTHPVSIDLGIGPECAKRMGLEHHYKGTALTTRAKAKAKKGAAVAAPAEDAAAPAGSPQPRHIVQSAMAELIEANEDELGSLGSTQAGAQQCAAWLAASRTAMEQGGVVLPLGQWLAAQPAPAAVDGACPHGSTNPGFECLPCHQAYLATLERDIDAHQRRHNRAANSQQYDVAQQLADKLDTLRAMRSEAVDEWAMNNSLDVWQGRVDAHPACASLDRNERIVLARWCFTNQEGIEANLAAMGYTVAAA